MAGIRASLEALLEGLNPLPGPLETWTSSPASRQRVRDVKSAFGRWPILNLLGTEGDIELPTEGRFSRRQ